MICSILPKSTEKQVENAIASQLENCFIFWNPKIPENIDDISVSVVKSPIPSLYLKNNQRQSDYACVKPKKANNKNKISQTSKPKGLYSASMKVNIVGTCSFLWPHFPAPKWSQRRKTRHVVEIEVFPPNN